MPNNINYFKNLNGCILDAQDACQEEDTGPKDPADFSELTRRLEACRLKLPPLYQEVIYKEYVGSIDRFGETGFNKILLRDPRREGEACIMLDIAQAILQHGEGYSKKATDAFQEVVSDLYDGFLSAEDRRDIKPPDLEVVAPLVKWGNPRFGPYTWPVDCTINFGVRAAIVSLPPANAQHGILAWAALSHETAGHDIIHADTGLLQEMKSCLLYAMQDANIMPPLPDYWAARIDETAADVLGILNMGPAVGIALIGYLRALNAAYSGSSILRNIGRGEDSHPADILRGYLASSVVRLLNFSRANEWALAIEAETDKDMTTIQLGSDNTVIMPDDAKRSAGIVAGCLSQTKMICLNNHALGDIQNWSDNDEYLVKQIRSVLRTTDPLPELFNKGFYAAHVVAAAITEALFGDSDNSDIPLLFARMISALKMLHDKNPSWGPLYVRHPGNVVPLKAYIHV
ncbi:MAG: hypothetical protein ACE14P_08600 [Methanotrichaceae archaeon]